MFYKYYFVQLLFAWVQPQFLLSDRNGNPFAQKTKPDFFNSVSQFRQRDWLILKSFKNG